MPDKNKISDALEQFRKLEAGNAQLAGKLDEFMELLRSSELDSENIKGIRKRINDELDQKMSSSELIEELKGVSLSDMGKMDQLDRLETLLNNNYLDSRTAGGQRWGQRAGKILKVIIGFLFITLGFAMIIMPAPPYFEMFTIFYFSPDDGVTLMDLISLTIIAIGTFLVIRSLINEKKV